MTIPVMLCAMEESKEPAEKTNDLETLSHELNEAHEKAQKYFKKKQTGQRPDLTKSV